MYCSNCHRRLTTYALRQVYLAWTPIPDLAQQGTLHEVPSERLREFLQRKGLPTNGCMQDFMDRLYSLSGKLQADEEPGSPAGPPALAGPRRWKPSPTSPSPSASPPVASPASQGRPWAACQESATVAGR